MKLSYLKIPLCIIIIAFFCSCGHTFIFYKHDNKVKTALTNKKNPPDQVTQLSRPHINIGDWRLDDLSASPDAEYLALVFSKWDTFDSEAKLEVYDSKGQNLKYTYDSEDFRDMIENNTNITYPSTVYFFHAFALGYEDENVLIVHIQPYNRSDLTPEDVRIKIDLQSNQVVGTPEFFSRTDRPAFPTHDSKSKYNFTVNNGKMYVNGNLLNGMPVGIDEELHDEVTTKEEEE